MADVFQFLTRVHTVVDPFPVYWSYVALALILLIIKTSFTVLHNKNSPPGPRGLPLLGNVLQLSDSLWLRFTEWKDQFGPIYSLNLAGRPVVVLNSRKVAVDLLDRRSNIYSDRPTFAMAGEIISRGLFIAFTGYGELLRRAGHQGLNIRAVESYRPLQEREAATLAADFLRDPDAWDDHIKRTAASMVLSAVYDWPPIESKDDPVVNQINDFVHLLARAASPGAYLVDIFPIMMYLPSWMAKWKREGLQWHKKGSDMFQDFMEGVREKLHAGGYHPGVAASLLDNEKRNGLSVNESAWLAGAMFGAGAETTAATLSVFMLAMRLYPDVMRKGQAEMDTVVGQDRLPTFADQPHLPYIQAIVKEVLRWRPVTPLGVPRRTTEDDWYNGHLIRKGTIIIPNIWAMNRDPEVFPDFDDFRPERFLDVSENIKSAPPATNGQVHVSYGFGRRICLGMHFANQSLFIAIATVLWGVNIEKEIDTNGVEIIPCRNESINEGLVVRPMPFKCKFTSRSKQAVEALEATTDRILS